MKLSWIASIIFLLNVWFWQRCQNEPFAQGKYIYEVKCSNCHLSDGKGLGKEIPSLHHASADPAYWSCIIRHGKVNIIEQDGVRYKRQMPENPELSPADISNVINYIQNQWVEEYDYVGLDSINIWLDQCQTN